MSLHPDDRNPVDDPDSGPESQVTDTGQDLHPAIDPREPLGPQDAGQPDEPHVAPPVDIDDREGTLTAPLPPEVIELPEHADIEQADEGLEAAAPVNAGPEAASSADGAPDAPPRDSGADAGPIDGDPDGPESEAVIAGSPGASKPPVHIREPADTTSGPLSGLAARLGIGKRFQSKDQADGPPPADAGDPASGSGPGAGGAARLAEGVRRYVDPRLHMATTAPHRRVVAIGAVLILLSLVANTGGLALILMSAIVPILVVITLTQHDVYEKESNLLIAAVGAGGALVGIVLSLLTSWIQASQWFDDGVLNYGAAGFGGRFADAAGSAPVVVWLLVGLILPAVAMAGMAGIPIAMRRWPQFRNEVMDGMILTGASGAGFAIGAALVHWWPMVGDPGPRTSVSDWTLSIIGVTLLRPAVITLCAAMVGAGIWRYMMAPSTSVIVLPAVAGAAGYLLLTFGSVQFQAAGVWPEFVWVGLVLIAAFVLYRRVLDEAVAVDRQALGRDRGRLVCPSCHKVTPAGAFCARCGKPLGKHDVQTGAWDRASGGG